MEIVRITDGDYSQYEELLLRRDQLEKEASEYQLEYLREFGEMITASFKEKLECIAIKKAITFCQMAKNHGETIDKAAMQTYLDNHMSAYYSELNNMIAQNNVAKSGTPISDYKVNQIKKIYRKIAKLLHPDISPLTRDNPELMQLFQDFLIAYRCNDLKRMQELEVLINKILADLGEAQANIIIDNIEGKIEELEEEISRILSTEPYLYKDLLADAFAVTEKKQKLEDELKEYQNYKSELQKILDSYDLQGDT